MDADPTHLDRKGPIRSRTAKAKGSTDGRPPAFDTDVYAGHSVVEHCFARLKQFRVLTTRYAKRAAYYRAMLIIAAIILWLREDQQGRP